METTRRSYTVDDIISVNNNGIVIYSSGCNVSYHNLIMFDVKHIGLVTKIDKYIHIKFLNSSMSDASIKRGQNFQVYT